MKNKLSRLWSAESRRRIGTACGMLGKLFSRNFGLKLLSLVLAVLLWNFVVSTNTTITRSKSVTGLTGYISSQASLSTYGLALLDNPTEDLSDITVVLEVPQSEYAYVSADNVQVSLDLSRVRTAGTQEVALKATTSYGKVVRIIPDRLSLTFEVLDSRTIPVNVQLGGDVSSEYWYNVSRINPSMLTVSGASSVVQSIASASVYIDVSDEEKTFTAAERYVLLDGLGNAVKEGMLNRSSSSISISVDVYPEKKVAVATDVEKVISGRVADGYVVESVSVQPETLEVAAEQELLDSITELNIEPVSVEGLTHSFAARTKVSALSSFKSVSAEQVYVYVTIAEESIGAWIDDVSVSFINKGEGLTMERLTDTVRVYVTGPRSIIEELREEGFAAMVDLEGLEAGEYDLGMSFPVETYPKVSFTPEISEVGVVLTEEAAE